MILSLLNLMIGMIEIYQKSMEMMLYIFITYLKQNSNQKLAYARFRLKSDTETGI